MSKLNEINPIYNINLSLLKKQKLKLVDILNDSDSEDREKIEALEGIVNLLDAIQDYVEDQNLGVENNE